VSDQIIFFFTTSYSKLVLISVENLNHLPGELKGVYTRRDQSSISHAFNVLLGVLDTFQTSISPCHNPKSMVNGFWILFTQVVTPSTKKYGYSLSIYLFPWEQMGCCIINKT